MAYELSAQAKLLSKQTGLKPNLVLKIEGVQEIYGSVSVLELIRIGQPNLIIDGSWVIGGSLESEDSRPWITLDKTSKSISQQLLQDKGGSSSVTNFKIELVDKNGQVGEALSPGNQINDILSAPAKIYLGFRDGAFPEDYIEILSGLVEMAEFGPSSAIINVSSSEQQKRREIFLDAKSKLNGAITGADTTITLLSTTGLLSPADALRTFIQVEDEIIEYTGVSGNDITGCVRGSLNTIATSHDNESETASFLTLEGNPIDLALKIMLSDEGNTNIEENTSIKSVNYVTTTNIIDGAYFFDEPNIQNRLGLVIGDLFSVSGTLSDFTNEPITGFGTNSLGSYILVASSGRPDETSSLGVATFKSKYNTLPEGLGIPPNQVDIKGHEEVNLLFGSAFPDYLLYIKEQINAKEFIEKQLYFPAGLYSLPRKGRAGVGYTSPPLAISDIKTLNADNVLRPESIRIQRSTSKWFYNSIIYKYELDSVEDKYLANKATLSADSTNRIKTGNKSIIIESDGLRDNAITENLIDRTARNLLNRYQFAADFIPKIDVLANEAFNIEVGDVVIFDGASLGVYDNSSGDRQFTTRLMEVSSKKLNISSAEYITLSLLDTNFGTNARFSVISPSSNLNTGSTTTILRLKESYSTAAGVLETVKWEDWQDNPIIVRTIDWSFQEVRNFEIHPTIQNALLLDSPLSISPGEDYVIDVATYDNSSTILKSVFGYINPSSTVDSGASSTQFNVPVGQESKFFSGGQVRVHNSDFSNDSGQVKITDIIGQTITCDDLGFTPVNGDEIELIGFASDEGLPYVML